MIPIWKLKICCIVLLTVLYFWISKVHAKVEFTNIKCTNLDPTFSNIEICKIKSVNRTYKHISVKAQLLQKNVMNCTINFKTMKKANGYKPFLYDITIDACKFLRHAYNPVVSYFYSFFRDYSNMNHTCPYDYLFADKVPISHVEKLMEGTLPIPSGDYALYMIWHAFNKPRVYVRVFVSLMK